MSRKGCPNKVTIPPEVRVWKYVDKSGGPDACWPWTGHVSKRHSNKPAFNYHHEYRDGKLFVIKVWTQRYIYSLHLGRKVPKHLRVYIVCGNHLCCNPAHMEMHKNGWSGNAKKNFILTVEQVEHASQLWCTGSMNQREMAKHFGVNRTTIFRAVHGIVKRDAVLCRKKRRHNYKKLNVWAIRAIRELRAEGRPLREVSEMFNIDKSHASRIARRITFADVV